MATTDQRTQFDYLLNAMESAGTHADPWSQRYGEKRQALFNYVRAQEKAGADALARVAALEAENANLLEALQSLTTSVNETAPIVRKALDAALGVTQDTPGGRQ